ncbi:MAG: hypothetical protein H6810_01715 [Phycisphaeraceae bacterium]|nr:MAG: hypothetical protein H6810_01715 [Phycisphaeraceae bacterium]
MRMTAAIVCALAGSAFAGTVITDWDSGTFEGWTTTGTNGGLWTNPGTGGNPGGYLQYEDDPNGGLYPNELLAPVAYLGDYSAFEGVGYFEYDVIHLQPNLNPTDYPRIRLFGDNGEEAFSKGGFIVTDTWTSLHFDVVAADFEMVSGTWADLIDNITELRISGDNAIGSGLEGGVDNFKLYIPAPGAASVLALAGLVSARRRH